MHSPLTHLLEGVMGIGMFVVGLGYLRAAVRDPEILRHSDFWKRILLLGCVVIFITYITIAYEVDLLKPPEQEVSRFEPGTEVVGQAKTLLLLILPIDLLGVALMAALFAVLSLQDLQDLLKRTRGDGETLRRGGFGVFSQVGLLFLITGIWHLLMVAWWFVYSLTTANWPSLPLDFRAPYAYDLLYHSSFGLAHLAYFCVWKQLEGGRWHGARASLLEWWGVAMYASLVITVYATRLSIYVDKRVAGGTANLQELPLHTFLMPAFVVASAILVTLAWRWSKAGRA